MNGAADQPLDRETAAEFAGWFRALADATRIQIVWLLARRGTPMSVGEIVAALDVGQSTVSAHLSGVTVTTTGQAADGLHSAIIRATKPAAAQPALPAR